MYNCMLTFPLLINCPNNCPHTHTHMHTPTAARSWSSSLKHGSSGEELYVAMARALDATRHDMDLCGILPVDEGEGTSTLCNHVNIKTPWGHVEKCFFPWWFCRPCFRGKVNVSGRSFVRVFKRPHA